VRDNGDALVQKTMKSYLDALNILRTRTEGTDQSFVAARDKYFDMS